MFRWSCYSMCINRIKVTTALWVSPSQVFRQIVQLCRLCWSASHPGAQRSTQKPRPLLEHLLHPQPSQVQRWKEVQHLLGVRQRSVRHYNTVDTHTYCALWCLQLLEFSYKVVYKYNSYVYNLQATMCTALYSLLNVFSYLPGNCLWPIIVYKNKFINNSWMNFLFFSQNQMPIAAWWVMQ